MNGTVTRHATTDTPLGGLVVVWNDAGLTHVEFADGWSGPQRGWRETPATESSAVQQLNAYFQGRRRTFDLPLAPSGTAFQLEVWRALGEIPYGKTVSYGELARRIGRPHASRAVGAANGANPLAIVVPCHRVIGSDGRLIGYGGGLARKAALLALEQRRQPSLFPI